MDYNEDKRTKNLALHDIHVGDWVQAWDDITKRYTPPERITAIFDDGTVYTEIDPEFKDLIRPLRRKEYLQLEENIPQQMDIFENLWKIYFESTDIRERLNEHCQINMCPKWYRKNMSEFEEKAI